MLTRTRNLLLVGIGCLLVWFIGGIFPYLINSPLWDQWKPGDPVTWFSNSIYWDFYYVLGVVGGWKAILVYGAICLICAIYDSLRIKILFWPLAFVLTFALLIGLLVTRDVEVAVMKVLE